MKIAHILLAALFATLTEARVGIRGRKRDDADEVEVVIVFREENDGADIFRTMSDTFTSMPEDIEVHAMLKRIKMATAKVKRKDIAGLMQNPHIEAVDEDVEFEMDGDPETPGDGISMALGDRPIPEFLKLSTGCDDPNTVKVAIIDGGIDLSHGDFGYCSRGFCEGRRFMSPTDQDWGESKNNHGSHVAGIVAASGVNGKYSMGMVSDEKICLVIGRVFNDDGGGANLVAVTEALDWAIEKGVHIMNLSFGIIGNDIPGLRLAISRVRQAGILPVASAGNTGGEDENYPASYGDTMSVAAIDNSKKWASFSTYNNQVDIAAPGVDIPSSFSQNRVGNMSGTSMSAPMVAGAAALMKRDCMQCTDQDIWNCLVGTTENINCSSQKCGAGLLQAGAAYECLRAADCCADPDPFDSTVPTAPVEPSDPTTTAPTAPFEPSNPIRTADPPVDEDPEGGQCAAVEEYCTSSEQCCSGRCRRRSRTCLPEKTSSGRGN